jgi:hypothetical protein
MNAWRKETTACQEATEACLESKEPTSLETESVAVHEEVPTEDVAVKTVKRTEEAAWEPASSCRAPPTAEETVPEEIGRRPRRMNRRVIYAQRKGHGRQGGTSKGRTFRKRRRGHTECNNGI